MSSAAYTRIHPKEKEYIVVERKQELISHWWKSLQILCYFVVLIAGIANSISVANINVAFQYQCILHANLSLHDIRIDNVSTLHTFTAKNVDEFSWGDDNSCRYCTFAPAASAAFAFVWGALFLQCGKGGLHSRNSVQPWRIVPPAIVFTFAFFIVSMISLGMVTSGLLAFCNNIVYNSVELDNSTTCAEVFQFEYPWSVDSISFYENYVIAQTSSVFVFLGWFMALAILVLRCGMHVDFVVMLRQRIKPEVKYDCKAEDEQNAYCTSTSLENSSELILANASDSSSGSNDEETETEAEIHRVPLLVETKNENLAKKTK